MIWLRQNKIVIQLNAVEVILLQLDKTYPADEDAYSSGGRSPRRVRFYCLAPSPWRDLDSLIAPSLST